MLPEFNWDKQKTAERKIVRQKSLRILSSISGKVPVNGGRVRWICSE